MDIKSSNKKKDTAKTPAKECKTSKDKSKADCNDSKPTIAEERKRFLGRNKKMTLPKEIVVTSGMDSGISKWLKAYSHKKKTLKKKGARYIVTVESVMCGVIKIRLKMKDERRSEK